MPTANRTATTRRAARVFRDDMLCPCFELTHDGFSDFMRENPAASFDDVLLETGAGQKCTACMLNLEYSFSEAGRGEAVLSSGIVPAIDVQSLNLKRVIYKVVDEVAPLVSSRTETWSPVLYGRDVSQRLLIANQHLLYDKSLYKKSGDGPVPHSAEVTVRDAAGKIRHTRNYDVPVGDVLGVELSQFLAGDADVPELAVGSVQIVQTWARPGFRGTTRSQIEIATPNAACAVHTQAPGPAASHRFTALYRPSAERLFHTVVNPLSRPLTGKSIARFAGSEEETIAEIVVPGYGAAMSEVGPPGKGAAVPEGSVVGLTWKLDGPHKLHVLCASPALDRYSIDHL